MDSSPPRTPNEGLPAATLAHSKSTVSTAQKSALQNALDVRIDVKGAYIVDEEGEETKDDDEEWKDEEDYTHDVRTDIRLPHNQSLVSHMAVDIGGSLIKICYWSFEEDTKALGGRLNFRKFPTDRIDACIEFMRQLAAKHRLRNGKSGEESKLFVVATGGGAYKFYDQIKEALGVEVMREDEMQCLIIGLDFFISQVSNEVFTYTETPPFPFVPAASHKHPYLLVNIGSGVSMIKVSGPRQFERVGGTSLGGGTLWGLLSLLTGSRNFEDMLKLAERGDNTKVDMLVGDIYGTDYNKIGLKSTTIASTLGKVYRTKRQAEREAEDHGGMTLHHHDDEEFLPSEPQTPIQNGQTIPSSSTSTTTAQQEQVDYFRHPGDLPNMQQHQPSIPQTTSANNHISFSPADISRSLLYAISNNIGQLAYLHAEKHSCEHIYFGGSFIGGHWQTMATLSYAIKFWSKGSKSAYFLRHEGYLGAVGAFLRRQDVNWGAGTGRRRASFDGLVYSLRKVVGRADGASDSNTEADNDDRAIS